MKIQIAVDLITPDHSECIDSQVIDHWIDSWEELDNDVAENDAREIISNLECDGQKLSDLDKIRITYYEADADQMFDDPKYEETFYVSDYHD